MKKNAVLMTIPFVMAVPPLVGWGIGHFLDKTFKTAPYLTYTLIIFGIIAAIRECYRIITLYGEQD